MFSIATLGYGEAAQAFISGWRSEIEPQRLGTISTFDLKIEDPGQHNTLIDACAALGVLCAGSRAAAFKGKSVIFSLVTADRALEAAEATLPFLDKSRLYLDCNSCSPATKQAAAARIEQAGVRYVDVAVMSPVHPAKHRTPLLLSGPSAPAAHAVLAELGMRANIAGERIGEASSIKMLRSVMIKGLEALTAECMLAARRAGVEKQVLASLQASDPGIDWTARSAYNFERMLVHGKRRAAEMREVAATLEELSLPNRMALATVDWQSQLGELDAEITDASLTGRADAILKSLST
ncbi:NAD(P)-dependent oxidoreductase [Agrobacterium vitis]|uniref:NAD(P)-dependent oxidoreductase n=1 Tax=Allorhizobium ampelinum TaxID=3025782 RepID=UPI001F207541|nr:DUF1932 domain-containing protein [Allorhizobium ampelinum]MCF1464837.1 NAD(P)-dependent oxidoreductase [Allorhizobium ampelinum]